MHDPHLVDRRLMLRGGGFAVALPALVSLLPRAARAAGPRKRLVLWYQPDGAGLGGKDYFYPKGGETDFSLNRITARLEPIRRDLVFVGGLDNTSSPSTGTEAHYGHMRSALTSGEPDSIDQVIADRLAAGRALKSLEIGVASDSGAKQAQMIYRGGRGVPPQETPSKLFARLFGENRDSPEQMALLARIQKRRKSILDAVKEDLGQLGRRAGAEDRKTLDAHASALRDLEVAIVQLNGAMVASCGSPKVSFAPLDGQTKFRGSWDFVGASVPNLEKIASVQHQLLVAALRCDLTRVASVTWLRSNSGQTYPFLPIRNKDGMNHGFAHTWRTMPSGEADYVAIMQWRCDVFRELVDLMRATPDGEGTLLDNTLLAWVSDYSDGDHSSRNVPYVLAGRAGGALKTGRYLRYDGQPHARLLISMAHAMGVPLTKFGAGTSPLERLVL